MIEVPVKEKEMTQQKVAKRITKMLPQWKVILVNDDNVAFVKAVHAVSEVMKIAYDQAHEKATEAHETGCALLTITHKERAEFIVDQFTSFMVPTTMELA